ncbi:MAG: hypothetical protein UU80_C0013G0020 [candidate division WWE3 bacterium GW2011_GWA1_41_8]|uniref:Lipid II isoglutaminyl synthase (glutamine-hydrolyzing) subunit MurT n=3 Tax=Katanobacteria TaxID=422282 RepID=A0A0G0ZJC1_UNCKA|nr:MAG: hypothetical protein UU72_C0015G0005 [candidate division WWE3 bacterium GW2011_GWB1_41_6]KKS22126.1 MAG: hypothetical protein UU80_C0013G0020 [candidate division WWE3 bacterium GW2011_GWA1_41_8]OGC56290.1 MAG: hypothetical protein A2976_04695 [candidate division WWE3 bacterium RIFCSPLOWO2_01_FULL_41_9]
MWLISTLIAKKINKVIKLLGRGSGFTFPGHVVLKIFPNILSSVRYPRGIILVSGTNGKTTTTKLITHLLESFGLGVVHNSTGANLLNGLVSTVLMGTNLMGKPLGNVAVLEVDEFALPLALKHLSPTALLLLNLSRDQLDRYGETDIILDKWKETVPGLSDTTILVCDSEQKEFHDIAEIFSGRTFYFDSDPTFLEKTKLHGTYNAKNVNAAVLTLTLLGYAQSGIEQGLEEFSVAYGRGEVITRENVDFQIFLAKNPASFNQNLDVLSSGKVAGKSILFVLNDNIPDGRDVSWIYDISPDKIKDACEGKEIYVSGTRALDMAVRLSYAGVNTRTENISENLSSSISRLYSDSRDASVTILPNYSAMLETREILIGRKIL